MKSVEISPEAYEDLEGLKEHLDEFFGIKRKKKSLRRFLRI